MNRFYGFILLFLAAAIRVADAQVIELGTGSTYTGTNAGGPANTSTFNGSASRYAYIFPQSTVSSLMHGDSIFSLDFFRNGGDSLSGTCNLKIYMRLGPNSDYGNKNINWVNQTGATGMKKVYDKNPAADFGKVNSWVRINLTTPYVADTTFGKNFELLVEYTQSNSQSSNIFWSFESRFTVNGYGSNQCKYTRTNGGILQDTTNSSSEVHPSIKINFPRYNQDASVLKVYSLGKLPVPLGNPDTVRAIIKNIGKQAFQNQMVYIISKGKNKLIDSTYISLKYLEEKLVSLPLLYPTNLGMDTIVVKIANDPNPSQNEAESYRIATENIYSYKDPTQSLAGGIGFNGSTGDFVAKFYSNNAKAINQINVSFSGSLQKFELGIWKANGKGGAPGTNIWTSGTLTAVPNFTTPVLPPVSVNGPFFVGVRQIGTTNVAFGYQEEDPVRPNTFYYAAPYGDTNWIDFSPDAPFKFAIEPRLQADHDVSPITYDFPKDTLNLVTLTTMAPKATIINYGAKDELTPFTVTTEIRRYGTLIYSSSRQDTLSTLRQHTLTFDSTFKPTQAGDHDVMVITKLGTDQMKDNDTLRKVVVVANFKDVGIGSLFDPDPYTLYEQFIDSVYPVANIQNFGIDAVSTFNVTAQILDSNKNVLYTDTKSTALASGSSNILVFKTYPCSTRGKLTFRIFTRLTGDTRKKNDTLAVVFNVVRSNDVTVTKGIYPQVNQAIPSPAVAKFINVELENLGDLNQADPFPVYCKISNVNGLQYYDSTMVTAYNGITTNMFFKKFLPVTKGYYQLICYSKLYNDQVKKNDTLKFNFAYGLPDDVEPLSPTPVADSRLELKKVYAPKAIVRNNGYNPQNTPFSTLFRVTQGASVIYSSVKSITLDSGKSKLITFDSSFSISDTGAFIFEVITLLSADFNRVNDTVKGYYYGVKYYDVGVSAILYPIITDTLFVNSTNGLPVVKVRNSGDSLVRSKFTTTLKIVNAVSGAILYIQNKDTAFSLVTPTDLTITFPKIGNIANPQQVKVIAYTNYSGDQFLKNDTAIAMSQFELWYDAIAQSIALPLVNGVYKTNSPILKPVATVKNGAKKQIDLSVLVFSINKVDTISSLETTVYTDSLNISNLNSNLTSTLTLNKDFDFTKQTPGYYKCYLDIGYTKDQNIANNTLQSVFRIWDATGISIIEFNSVAIYPNPASHFLMINMKEVPLDKPMLNIYNVNGQKVKEQMLSEVQTIVDISGLQSGTYFIELNHQRMKLVVVH